METSDNEKEKFSTLSLQKVKDMLGYTGKGFRSVIRWCFKKNITVFGVGRRRRILESDWIRIQQNDFINSIRLTYPTSWMSELKKRGIEIIHPTTHTHYSAQSSEAIKLLNNWDDE